MDFERAWEFYYQHILRKLVGGLPKHIGDVDDPTLVDLLGMLKGLFREIWDANRLVDKIVGKKGWSSDHPVFDPLKAKTGALLGFTRVVIDLLSEATSLPHPFDKKEMAKPPGRGTPGDIKPPAKSKDHGGSASSASSDDSGEKVSSSGRSTKPEGWDTGKTSTTTVVIIECGEDGKDCPKPTVESDPNPEDNPASSGDFALWLRSPQGRQMLAGFLDRWSMSGGHGGASDAPESVDGYQTPGDPDDGGSGWVDPLWDPVPDDARVSEGDDGGGSYHGGVIWAGSGGGHGTDGPGFGGDDSARDAGGPDVGGDDQADPIVGPDPAAGGGASASLMRTATASAATGLSGASGASASPGTIR